MDIEREVVRLRRRVRLMALILFAGIAYLLVSEVNDSGKTEIGGLGASGSLPELTVKNLRVEKLEVVDSSGRIGARMLTLLGRGFLFMHESPESLSKEEMKKIRVRLKPLFGKKRVYAYLTPSSLQFHGKNSERTSLYSGWLMFNETSKDGQEESTLLRSGILSFNSTRKDGKKESTSLHNGWLSFTSASKDGQKEATHLRNGSLELNRTSRDGKKLITRMSCEEILSRRLFTEDVRLVKLDGSLPALAGKLSVLDGRGQLFLWDARVKSNEADSLALGPRKIQMRVKDPNAEEAQFSIQDLKSEIGWVDVRLLSKETGSNTGPAIMVRDSRWKRYTILKAARAHWVDSGIGKGLFYPNVDSLLPLKK